MVKRRRKRRKKFTTTKLIVLFLFLNCTIIELFTGWTIVQSIRLAYATNLPTDFSPLITLIGTVVGEVISFAVYSVKATRENTKGGIVYENAMHDNQTLG